MRTAGASRYNPLQYKSWKGKIHGDTYDFLREFDKKVADHYPSKWRSRLLVEATFKKSDASTAPDASNILKAVEDALSGYIWKDDDPTNLPDVRCKVLFAEEDQYEALHITVFTKQRKRVRGMSTELTGRSVQIGRLL